MINAMRYLDLKITLAGGILVKVDRASMAVSLEVRCPVIDHVFMEQVAKIPSGRKLKGGDKKHIFKQALRKLLPDDILYRQKMGFSVPITEWLRGDLRDYARDLVLDGEGTKGYFNRGYVEKLWSRHQSGVSNFGTELWILMMFNLWHRRFAEIPAAVAGPSG